MKVDSRYLSPKSPLSERGLAVATLRCYVCLVRCCLLLLLSLCRRLCRHMKVGSRYPPPKSSSSGGGLTVASLRCFVCFVRLLMLGVSWFFVNTFLSFRAAEAKCHFERPKGVEKSSARSFNSGFIVLISQSFFSRLHLFNFFSLSMACSISEYFS